MLYLEYFHIFSIFVPSWQLAFQSILLFHSLRSHQIPSTKALILYVALQSCCCSTTAFTGSFVCLLALMHDFSEIRDQIKAAVHQQLLCPVRSNYCFCQKILVVFEEGMDGFNSFNITS